MISFNEGEGQRAFLETLRKRHALHSIGEAVTRALYELMSVRLGNDNPDNPRPAPMAPTLPPGARLVKTELRKAAEGLTVGDLIKKTCLSQSTVNNAIKQLEQIGRVECGGYRRPEPGQPGRIAIVYRLIGEDLEPDNGPALEAAAERARARAMKESNKLKVDIQVELPTPDAPRALTAEEQEAADFEAYSK